MGELPRGVVTFVFTDIEGSTRLFRRLGDAYPPLLERHNHLMRTAWEGHGGREVKTEGDAFFVAFADAAAAIAACVDAQQALQAAHWPPDGVVRVRMGVHAGLAYPRDDDYVAFAVHQAARVVAAANGGQIVVSEHAAALAGPIAGVALQPVGRFRLRDFDEPVELLSAAGSGMVATATALRAVPADGHNLVKPRTRLIGRDTDVGALAELSGRQRLVSIVGPGGVGKTRLVTELGLRLANDWPGGVWFVDLSVISDPSVVDIAVAEAVGCPIAGNAAARSTLLDDLSARAALIIFDNCEHVVDDVASIVDAILLRCPDVGVITTSRISLGRVDEVVWRLGPLQTEGDAGQPAIELFIERANAVNGVRSVAADDPAIASICRRLDGLPLAIELAAARVAVLTPAEIDVGLEDRFRLLRGRDRTAPERQRTLEALLDWSYQLLSADEQTALCRLGTFAASFDTETATAALSADDLDAYDAPELVWSLADKSLIVVEPAANATRYRLLDSIRHYARRHLEDRGATAATAHRLAAWYLDRLGPGQLAGPKFDSNRASEVENLKALVDILERDDPSTAQSLVIAVDRLHRFATPYLVAIAYLRDGLRRLPEPTPMRVDMLCRLGYLCGTRGESDVAREAVDEAMEVMRVAGRPAWDPTMVQAALADHLITIGDHQGALETAVHALDDGPSDRGRVALHNRAAIGAFSQGDMVGAARWFELALEMSLRSGETTSLSYDYGNLAEVAYRRGDLVLAAEHQLSALRIAGQLDDRVAIAFSMILAGRLAHRRGELATFVQINAAGETVLDALGTELYDEDRQLTDGLLAEAGARLGPSRVEAAHASGAALDLPAAIAITESVLVAAATP